MRDKQFRVLRGVAKRRICDNKCGSIKFEYKIRVEASRRDINFRMECYLLLRTVCKKKRKKNNVYAFAKIGLLISLFLLRKCLNTIEVACVYIYIYIRGVSVSISRLKYAQRE